MEWLVFVATIARQQLMSRYRALPLPPAPCIHVSFKGTLKIRWSVTKFQGQGTQPFQGVGKPAAERESEKCAGNERYGQKGA